MSRWIIDTWQPKSAAASLGWQFICNCTTTCLRSLEKWPIYHFTRDKGTCIFSTRVSSNYSFICTYVVDSSCCTECKVHTKLGVTTEYIGTYKCKLASTYNMLIWIGFFWFFHLICQSEICYSLNVTFTMLQSQYHNAHNAHAHNVMLKKAWCLQYHDTHTVLLTILWCPQCHDTHKVTLLMLLS